MITVTEKEVSKLKKHYRGCYRISTSHGFYQIKRMPDGWLVELRDELGNLVGYSGTWKTLRDAYENTL